MSGKEINIIFEEIVKRNIFDKNIDKKIFVFIGGHSRSGKSTLALNLQSCLVDNGISAQIIALDDWIISIKERTNTMNIYEIYNYKSIIKDLEKLIDKGNIEIEAYEQYSRGVRRIKKSYYVEKSGVVIVDGIISLGIDINRQIESLRIFVEVDENTRKERIYEFYKKKNLNSSKIDELYYSRLNSEVKEIEKTKVNADIIIKLSSKE